MTYLSCTPAYGRDYKTAKAVRAAWFEGKDWIAQAYGSTYDGKPICKGEADAAGITVNLRYKGNTQVVSIRPRQ